MGWGCPASDLRTRSLYACRGADQTQSDFIEQHCVYRCVRMDKLTNGICVCVWEGGGGRCTHDESLSDMDDVIMTACYRTKRPWYGCVCVVGVEIYPPAPAEECLPRLPVCVCVCWGGGGGAGSTHNES